MPNEAANRRVHAQRQHFVGVPDTEGRHGPLLIWEDVWITHQLSFVSSKGQMTCFPPRHAESNTLLRNALPAPPPSPHLFSLSSPSSLFFLSRWRIDPALCRWSRVTAAPPPSIPPTTRCSPPPRQSTSWTSASPASSRGASELQLTWRYFDKQRLPVFYQTMFAVIGALIRSVFDVLPALSAKHVYSALTRFCFVSF